MRGPWIAAGMPLATARTLERVLMTMNLKLSVPWTMIPLRKAITSAVPPPAAGG